MLKFLKNFERNKIKKHSSVGNLVACNLLNKPVWTPRRYDALSHEGYQKNVIVYRCINLISKGLASVPLLVYKNSKNGKQEVEKHPLIDLLNSPSPKQAGSAFMESLVAYLLLSGNSYVEAVLGGSSYPQELYTLRPDRMRVIAGSGGVPKAYEYCVDTQKKTISVDHITGKSKILHIRTFNPLNDWYGMSPIEAASCAIDQHNAVSNHNLSILQNGGRPSGALIIKPQPHSLPLSDEQRQSLRDDLKKLYEGNHNAGRIMIMEGDFAWQEMGLSPKDLDFISGKQLSAREIAQAYGVPPMLVGVPGDATFSNYREARFHLWEDTILPLLDFVIAELNLWLVPYFCENLIISYDHDEIPALSQKREDTWAKISQACFLTINEKRQALGYDALEGGDVLATNFHGKN
jgi:HK97 family phage portal protein